MVRLYGNVSTREDGHTVRNMSDFVIDGPRWNGRHLRSRVR